tara:strand:+ start:20084 stop:20419 length:336 start_codon:yes stop_codon:yes gene_type:complete
MAVESAADRAVFLDADEHGLQAMITPSGMAAVPVSGIFDENYSLIGETDEASGLSSREPTLTVRSADLPNVELRGGVVALTDLSGANRLFKIVEPKPDGTGITELRLYETL